MQTDQLVHIKETIVGKGVFATQAFPENVVLSEITGKIIDDANFSSSYSFDIGDNLQLDPEPPFRFLNHSCEPNCEFDWWFDETWDQDELENGNLETVFASSANSAAGSVQSEIQTGRRRAYLITLREIEPGEELTIDYNWTADAAIQCFCGAPTCRGWVVCLDELQYVDFSR